MLATRSNAPTSGHREASEGRAVAPGLFTPSPALSVIRPASVPASVDLFERAHFDTTVTQGPTRHDLADGLIVLNAMDAISDDALLSAANGALNDTVLWGQIEGAFGAHAATVDCGEGVLVSPLISDCFSLRSLVRHWLDWHELIPVLIPDHVLTVAEAIPGIGHRSPASERLCWQLPGVYEKTSDGIAEYLNSLIESPDKDNMSYFPLSFIGCATDAGRAPLAVGCGDLIGLCLGADSADFTAPYWRALVQSLKLIGACLRPMMTPDAFVEAHPTQMEEEAEDVDAIVACLKERGESPDDEDAVEAVIEALDLCFIDCFGGFQFAMESVEITQRVNARWFADEAVPTVSAFGESVATLPPPSNDAEQRIAPWFQSVVEALPDSEASSALARVRTLADVQGSVETMLPVFFSDEVDYSDAVVQPAYEVYMSDPDERAWLLGWDIPPALLVTFAEGVRAGNELLDDLDRRLTC